MSTLKHIRSIVLLPVMVTVVIPGTIVYLTGQMNPGWSLPTLLKPAPFILGALFICCGLILMLRTVSLFARIGKGTLAPWDPTQRLVVHGVYRHVRNPMISGVCGILLGEAIIVGSVPLVCWSILFLVANLIYIPLLEEPGLVRRFGKDYVTYKQNVPRWIPRLRPWEGQTGSEQGPPRDRA